MIRGASVVQMHDEKEEARDGEPCGLQCGVPRGIRTPVIAVKGQCPGPLDDGNPTRLLYQGRQERQA